MRFHIKYKKYQKLLGANLAKLQTMKAAERDFRLLGKQTRSLLIKTFNGGYIIDYL